jgi:hypothetical protein
VQTALRNSRPFVTVLRGKVTSSGYFVTNQTGRSGFGHIQKSQPIDLIENHNFCQIGTNAASLKACPVPKTKNNNKQKKKQQDATETLRLQWRKPTGKTGTSDSSGLMTRGISE